MFGKGMIVPKGNWYPQSHLRSFSNYLRRENNELFNPNQTGLFGQSKDRGGGDSPRRFIKVLWPQFSSKFTKNGLKGLLA